MLLYYITDRQQFCGNEAVRRKRLLAKIAEAARAGVDYIQLRERDLSTRELEGLACLAMQAVRAAGQKTGATVLATKLLINSRIDIALAVAAHGVHLRSTDIAACEARSVWTKASTSTGSLRLPTADCIIAVSCHTPKEVRLAEARGADLAVFAPVFEKAGVLRVGSGVDALQTACGSVIHMPVLALGGVTVQNARACLEAGAAGIAGIRLFQDYDIGQTASDLRAASFDRLASIS